MSHTVFIINAHQKWPFSEGLLNAAIVEFMRKDLEDKGYTVRLQSVEADYDIETEVAQHQWADTIIFQCPVNLMGVPWKAKKYMDEVYSAGLDGRLCHSDGRSSDAPKLNYGTGGTLQGKNYMISLTFNAPLEAFNNPADWFFSGKNMDDLFYPQHLNFKFFGMTPLESFAFFDVMKNPDIENDFVRLKQHLDNQLPALTEVGLKQAV